MAMTPGEKTMIVDLVKAGSADSALHGIKNQLIIAGTFVSGTLAGGLGGLLVGLLVRH